jgi:hypothetical protein
MNPRHSLPIRRLRKLRGGDELHFCRAECHDRVLILLPDGSESLSVHADEYNVDPGPLY